ncbi:DNA repair protein RecN [candidate division KSB1 bacterium]|nr:DNA repair protein RecN [candidate division KSB1 bacterium]
MLRSLYIRNYLLVSELRLDFEAGLTVLTGETGAGKSMIVGAIDALLGEKFPRDSLGGERERAVVEGWFAISPLTELQEFVDDDDPADELIVRREFSRQGRTRTFLNDRPVNSDLLAKVRGRLVDFHGQREQNSLFDPLCQLDYVDAFAGSRERAIRVRELFQRRQALAREVGRLRAEIAAQQKERALLSYQLEEIERLGLRPGEEAEIESRLARLEGGEKLSADCQRLLSLLSEADPSLVTMAGQAKLVAGSIAKVDREFDNFLQEFGDISSRLKDVANSVRIYADSLQLDEAELNRLRERRGTLWDLRRKHGVSVDQILARADELKLLLQHGAELDREAEQKSVELTALDQELIAAARDLSAKRNKAAKALAAKIVEQLRPLGFPSPHFDIMLSSKSGSLSGADIGEHGLDSVQFLFTANPGTNPAPIADVASGGETSRVTLAIKSVLADAMSYPLLVYDEIDLGISGKTADAVGKALAELSRHHQVLVITHLPQIAARADRHLCVFKQTDGKTSETSARFLDQRERVEAIAALIAGVNITDQARASASELLRANGKLQAA